MSNEILSSSLTSLANKIAKKELTSVQVTEAYLNQINSCNKSINAFVHTNEKALDEAKAADAKIQKGEVDGPLLGVPVGIKDLLCVKDMSTTAASNCRPRLILLETRL